MLVGCMIKSTEWEQFDWFQSSSLCSLLVMRRAFMHKWFHNVPHRKCEFHVAIKTTYVIQWKCPVLCLPELTNDERLIIEKDFSSADSHYDHCLLWDVAIKDYVRSPWVQRIFTILTAPTRGRSRISQTSHDQLVDKPLSSYSKPIPMTCYIPWHYQQTSSRTWLKSWLDTSWIPWKKLQTAHFNSWIPTTFQRQWGLELHLSLCST